MEIILILKIIVAIMCVYLVRCLFRSSFIATKFLISIGIIILIAFIFEDKIRFFILNDLNYYHQDNQQIIELEKEIYDDYGIKVYTGLRPETVHIKLIKTNENISDNSAIKFLKSLKQELSIYKEKAFFYIPKEIYIVKNIYANNMEAGGVNCGNFITYDPDESDKSTIHHELFHSLDINMGFERYQRFKNNKEACNLTSSYACTATKEFLAEAWSESICKEKDNKHIRIVREIYPLLLKDGDSSGITKIDNLIEKENHFTDSYDEPDRALCSALEFIFETGINDLAIPYEVKKREKAIELIKLLHPYCINVDNITTYYNDGYQIIHIDEEQLADNVERFKRVGQITGAYEGYFEDLDSYEIIKRAYESLINNDDEEIDVSLAESDGVNLFYGANKLLFKLRANGIETVLASNNVVVYLDDNYYWLIPNLDSNKDKVRIGFMLSGVVANQMLYTKPKNIPEDCFKSDDMSLSYLARNELYVDEYDEAVIKNYIRKAYTRGLTDDGLYICCKSKTIGDQVISFLKNSTYVNDAYFDYSRKRYKAYSSFLIHSCLAEVKFS